jgi:threonine dehydratase
VETPCLPLESLSRELSCELTVKCENLQHIGAFKARGATNAIFMLSDEDAAKGVVTHSSGNHAAAVARAAKLRNIPAYVVMPENSAQVKIQAVRGLGVEPEFCTPHAESRAAVAAEIQARTGATMIHPYDDPRVMAGQGTVGLEILEQFDGVDVLFVPVGGGGLLSGLLVAVKAMNPAVQVIAAEPEWADDAYRSLKSGQIEMPTRVDTIADGLRSPLGEQPFQIIKRLVDDIVLVSEADIAAMTRKLAERAHLVVEPSGAVAMAGVQRRSESLTGKRVAAVITGGNIDFGGCKLGGK